MRQLLIRKPISSSTFAKFQSRWYSNYHYPQQGRVSEGGAVQRRGEDECVCWIMYMRNTNQEEMWCENQVKEHSLNCSPSWCWRTECNVIIGDVTATYNHRLSVVRLPSRRRNPHPANGWNDFFGNLDIKTQQKAAKQRNVFCRGVVAVTAEKMLPTPKKKRAKRYWNSPQNRISIRTHNLTRMLQHLHPNVHPQLQTHVNVTFTVTIHTHWPVLAFRMLLFN